MTEVIVQRLEECVGMVSINRPQKRNACNRQTWQLIADAFAAFGEDKSIRLVILTGEGGHFSAGDDIVAYNDAKSNSLAAETYRQSIQASFNAVLRAPFPVIAAIEGVCVGGAVSLAMCCDFRIVHETAKICIPVANLSLVYPTAHIQRLVHLIGASAARRWLYSAAFINGEKAERDGFADKLALTDVVRTAIEFGQSMLNKAPLSIAGSKLQINSICDDTLSLAQPEIEERMAKAEASNDYQLAVQAFRNKTSAVFTGS